MIVVGLLFLLASTAHVLSEGIGGNHQAQCIEKEKEALLSFKRDVDPGNILSSWTNSSTNHNCCTWRGVTCDNQTNHVIKIDFSGVYDDDYAIGGEIGSSLVELKNLKYLDFSGSNFSRIPKFIGSLKNLEYLDLAGNPLGGTIPPELGNLTKLQLLDLSSSSYHDQMIADNFKWLSHLTSLRTFSLMNSNFTKAGLESFKVTPSVSSLEIYNCLLPRVDTSFLAHKNYSSNSLKTLILQENSIHPTAITWFLNSSNHLNDLTFSYNSIDGSIPDSFGEKNSLSLIYMDHNDQFESGLPKSLVNLTNLKVLDLSGNNLGGTLHDLLENLTGSTKNSLEILSLYSNQIGGLILDDEKTFPSLRTLDLANNQLEGHFPKRLSRFPSLQILSLDENHLTGPLPDLSSMSSLTSFKAANNKFSDISTESIGELYHLETLDVSSNSLTGVISEVNLRCPKLKMLDLSFNPAVTLKFNSTWVPSFQLTFILLSSCNLGPHFPHWLENQFNLSYLDISNSDITGSVPNWFSNITSKLRILDLSNNQLSGTLPDFWENFGTLSVLKLENNNLSGEIPGSIASSSFYIKTIQMGNNNFSGTLPSSLKNCTQLRVLDFGRNNLEGIIPSWIGERLKDLAFLSLKSNNFYGSIPLTLCHLTEIQILDLSLNNLAGAIPSCFENFTSMVQKATDKSTTISIGYSPNTNSGIVEEYQNVASLIWKGKEYQYDKILGLLRIIDLSHNKLSGEIPVEVTHLVELVQLNLSRNALSGAIPKNIGNLTKLESLDLSHNKLSGKIPISFAKIFTLNYLDLSNNRLSGRIPTSTQLQSFNNSTYAMNFGLCGPPITSSCPGDDSLPNTSDSTRDDEDGREWFDISWFYIGIGVGFIIGFAGVCGNLLINTSWRHAYFQFMYSLGDLLYVMINVQRAALRRKLLGTN